MSKERDFLYDNPPLAEVIAEIHWELVPLMSMPGGGVDPSFEPFSRSIKTILADSGYTHIERMIPDQVPLEFLAHKVVSRFRTGANTWPLFQIGPGLLTANIVPPYEGWRSFVPTLKLGFEALHRAYPSASTHLRIKRMELRYIDAFTKVHGMEHQGDFIRSTLKLGTDLPDGIRRHAANVPDPILQTGQTRMRLQAPSDSIGAVAYETGTAGNQPAVVLTFTVVKELTAGLTTSPEAMLAWFDAAHEVVREWFDALLPDEIKRRFGSKRHIQAH